MNKNYIYIITNTVLQKQYVGSRICHKFDIKDDNYWGSSKYLNEDYKIYGKDKFVKEILEEIFDINNLLDSETKNILKYNTLAPNGYNKYLPNKRKGFHMHGTHLKLSEEHKQKLRRPKSEETKQKIRKANKGKTHPAWNKGLTKETNKSLKEMSKKQSIRFLGKNNPNFGGKITKQPKIKQKISTSLKARYINEPELKQKISRKGKKQPPEFGMNHSKKIRGKNNGRYILLADNIIKEIIYLYTIKKLGLGQIADKLNISYYKIKKILMDNKINIIKNQYNSKY